MTIEEKLRKTLQTKTGLKEVINAKGGTITDETPFEEYITQVENLSGGGSSVTYVPVPNEGYVDKIYFNNSLSIEEVDNIINNANIEWVDGEDGMKGYGLVYVPDWTNGDGYKHPLSILLMQLPLELATQFGYNKIINVIFLSEGFNDNFIFASEAVEALGVKAKGWGIFESDDPDNCTIWHPNPLKVGLNVTVQGDAEGLEMTFGTQNEALKELIYVDKLVDGNGYAEVVSTAEEMEANLTAENKHKFYLYNGEDGQYTNGEYYAVVDDEETVIEENRLKKLLDTTKSTSYMFYNSQLDNVDELIKYNDTENVENFSFMFCGATNLKNIPKLNFSKMKNANSLFSGTYLGNYITEIDTTNVEIASSMFKGNGVFGGSQYGTFKFNSLSFPNCYNIQNLFYQNLYLEGTDFTLNLGNPSLTKDTVATSVYSYININENSIKNFTFNIYSASKIDLSYCFRSSSILEKIEINIPNGKITRMDSTFFGCTKLNEVIGNIDVKDCSTLGSVLTLCSNITKITFKNIKLNLQLGSGTSWGHLLTVDSLINTCKECINVSSARTLTIGTANIEKLANVYVRLTNEAEEDETLPKLPMEVCESTDTGAMLISEYMTLKNWSIA